MRSWILLGSVAAVVAAAGVGGWAVQNHQNEHGNKGRRPETMGGHTQNVRAPTSGSITPHTVVFRDVPVVAPATQATMPSKAERGAGDAEAEGRERSPIISAAEADRRRAQALQQPVKAARVQQLSTSIPGAQKPAAPASTASFNLLKGFNGPDISQCCGTSASVPPDTHMAAGRNHVIATVNTAIGIYDKSGALLNGPVTSDAFFNDPTHCAGTFDPTVEYDEGADRWIINYDASPNNCIAVSQTGDPTGAWNVYFFDTGLVDPVNDLFDYPHIGVGDAAIYVGANIFGASFSARVWALPKAPLYAGQPLIAPVAHDLAGVGTPTPMVLHGSPSAPGVEYIVTDDTNFSGDTFGIWVWADPTGATAPTLVGYADLAAATGVTAQSPIDQSQLGSTVPIQANDVRTLDAEWRNGKVWLAHQMSCNVGAGPQGCARWAQVDPTNASVVQAGVFTVFGHFVSFPNLAVDANDDMALGFTVMGPSRRPSVYVAGRFASDPKGLLRDAVEVKRGQTVYNAFDAPPQRWGDYSGMAADPDGQHLWYLGEYSKAGMASPYVPGSAGNWGTFIQQVGFGVPDAIFTGRFEPLASLELHAEVNGDDADVAPGPGIATGDPVTQRYVVINTGLQRLTSVIVTDQALGVITCPTNTLEAGEDMLCDVSASATSGAHNISASVSGVAPDGTAVTATDGAHYQVTTILAGTKCTASGGVGCPEPLTDNGTVTSTFTVSGCATIDDVNVGLSVNHTYVGDLLISLTSPGGGATVRLVNSPVNGNDNCPGNNLRTLLDDSSSGAIVDSICTTNDPAIFGNFKPSLPLSAFNGHTGNGTWTLTVQDVFLQDTGTLNDWSLQLTCH